LTKYEKLFQLLKENNGYLFTSQVIESDISKTYLARFVKENNLEKVAHGVYVEAGVWPDELYILQLKNPKIVFSGETALYLNLLVDREYNEVCVTVPTGHNGSRLRERGVQVHEEKEEIFELGVIEVETNFGHKVRTYNEERCICDLVTNRGKIEVQQFQTAMKGYMGRREKDLSRLMAYAEKMKIRDEVMKYVEVLV